MSAGWVACMRQGSHRQLTCSTGLAIEQCAACPLRVQSVSFRILTARSTQLLSMFTSMMPGPSLRKQFPYQLFAQWNTPLRDGRDVLKMCKRSTLLVWMFAQSAQETNFAPKEEATPRGRLLQPTRRTPAPPRLVSIGREVRNRQEVVDSAFGGVGQVVGASGEDVKDPFQRWDHQGPALRPGRGKIAAGHGIRDVGGRLDPVKLRRPSHSGRHRPKGGQDSVHRHVFPVPLFEGRLARGIVYPGDPQFR